MTWIGLSASEQTAAMVALRWQLRNELPAVRHPLLPAAASRYHTVRNGMEGRREGESLNYLFSF